MIKYILTFLTLFAFTLIGVSQDVSFSQINNNKLYLNPAFANSRVCPELTMSYRNQWPSLGSTYVTSMVSYEQSILNKRNGFGLMLMNDRSGNGIYSLNSVNMYFSNQQKIKRNLNLKIGLEFGYRQNFIDDSKLFFEDSFNGQSFTNMTNEPLLNGLRVHYFDIGAGGLLFNDRGYIGFAVNHLNEPNQSLIFGESYLPMKYGLHGGLHIEKNKNSYFRQPLTYMPSFSLLRQGEFTQLTINNNIKKDNFLFGGGFRLVEGYSYRDAIILNFGVDTGELLFFYSYDFTVSPLGPNTGGSHEITTIIKVESRRDRNKITVPSCAF
jgi:type IX secretion system PorP/SprF family membrane protein